MQIIAVDVEAQKVYVALKIRDIVDIHHSMDYREALTCRQFALNALDVAPVSVNPSPAPSLEQQVMGVVLEAVTTANFEERSPAADAAEYFLDHAVLVRLGVNLKAAKTRIGRRNGPEFISQGAQLPIRDCFDEVGMSDDWRKELADSLEHRCAESTPRNSPEPTSVSVSCATRV
jgi:hypothetical protein